MVVGVLRPFRSAHNFVGGGAALNRGWPRLSDDMDIFSDVRGQLPDSVGPELQALCDAGYAVEVTTRDAWMVEAIVRKYGFETKVQWLDESETCTRFFPAVDDAELGFRLHQADVAVNKVLCASRRDRAARDAVDLVNIAQRYCPLGPLVWAAAAKSPQSSPLRMTQDIRKITFGYSDEEIRTVRMEDGNDMTRAGLRAVLDVALRDAYDFCDEIAPVEHTGCLFVDATETPTAADDRAIAAGVAIPIRLKNFAAIPRVDS